MLGLIIGSLIFGIILGPLARLILPGRQSIGIGWTIGAGFIGALVGGLVANAVGLSDTDDNIDWLRILVQLICAVVAVAAIAAWKGNQSGRTVTR
ncbi:MAG: GlsB/YeaQ/YmgE family stress response membrane protein [Nocardioidaceae bacterium]